MSKTIRNLHESEIQTSGDDLEMGRRYLDAEKSENPFVAYVYRAPETRKTYIVSSEDLTALGRIVYAIANQTTEYLKSGEAEKYADPNGESLLCDYGCAYSLWCASTDCAEGIRCDVDL